jgi:predicted RND superfamily exporter protein
MLYTSLTSAAGFASLALTPIPPVQIFGVFVAFGIMAAWVLTVTFVPAFIMFIPEKSLANFGVSHAEEAPATALTRALHRLGRITYRYGKVIIAGAVVVLALAVWGISRIDINDNPTKWFVKSHPIRVADRVLNRHFAGTYQAYLALEPQIESLSAEAALAAMRRAVDAMRVDYLGREPDGPAATVYTEAADVIRQQQESTADTVDRLLGSALAEMKSRQDAAPDELYRDWDRVMSAIESEVAGRRSEPFKRPDLLRYVEGLQQHLSPAQSGAGEAAVVGKSNSAVDIVKKVHKEISGEADRYRVPDTVMAVASCYTQFQNSHTPDDLWHFVTPDFRQANIWIQLRSGDNNDMELVLEQVEQFMAENPPPVPLDHRWFGLTYINVIWQQKMVSGMLQAFLGSFLVVFILMTVLFQSALWGLLSMIPLTITIALIYGLIGHIGKDYDMPVAVLSSLTLGLAVDFAIHFLARARSLVRERGSWQAAVESVFGEPARAISRNAIVVAVGFLPLLAAPLVPYKTVGMFMAGILATAAVGTLLILPALVNVLRERLFAERTVTGITCHCAACMVLSVAGVVLLALTLHGYWHVGWNALTWTCVIALPAMVFVCGFLCRRRECRRIELQQAAESRKENGE